MIDIPYKALGLAALHAASSEASRVKIGAPRPRISLRLSRGLDVAALGADL